MTNNPVLLAGYRLKSRDLNETSVSLINLILIQLLIRYFTLVSFKCCFFMGSSNINSFDIVVRTQFFEIMFHSNFKLGKFHGDHTYTGLWSVALHWERWISFSLVTFLLYYFIFANFPVLLYWTLVMLMSSENFFLLFVYYQLDRKEQFGF